jgi:hypothetical protein
MARARLPAERHPLQLPGSLGREAPSGDHGKEGPADNGRAVGRFASAIAFLATLAVVLLAAGCGQRFERAGNAPAPGDLAADALAALQDAGSAHFVADMKTTATGAEMPFSVHVEGDASTTALDAEGSVTFGGFSLQGRVLAGEHAFFLEFGGRWYGDETQGIADAFEEAAKEHDGQVWNELATPEGLRRNFGELFAGKVTEGPDVDGVATWQFEGRFDVDGVVEFARRFDAEPTPEEAEQFRLVAEASRIVLVVGREDHLPRRLEVTVELSDEVVEELQDGAPMDLGSAESFTSRLELSEFGKPVEIEAPDGVRPLDELFEDLFGSFE